MITNYIIPTSTKPLALSPLLDDEDDIPKGKNLRLAPAYSEGGCDLSSSKLLKTSLQAN